MGLKYSGFDLSRAFNFELGHINTGFSKRAWVRALLIKNKAWVFSGTGLMYYELGPRPIPALDLIRAFYRQFLH